MLQPRNHPEHALLLGVGHLGLEADHVQQAAQAVVAPQLHHGVGRFPGARVFQAHRLHRPEARGVLAPLGHLLDRHAALEERNLLEILERDLLGAHQLAHEGLVLRFIHRAVQVIARPVARVLVVAVLPVADVHVHGLGVHDRRDGVEEAQRLLAGQARDGAVEGVAGQRAGGDQRQALGRDLRYLAADDLDARLGLQRRGDPARELLAIHGQGRAGGNAGLVGGGHDERAQPAHLLVQQAHGVLQMIGAEGVGAHQLGALAGAVGGRFLLGAHLEQAHGNAAPGQLPGGLRAGQPRADDGDGLR